MREFLPKLDNTDSEAIYYNFFDDMPELENVDDDDNMPELENVNADDDADKDDNMPELENADANADANNMPELENADANEDADANAERSMRLFYIFIFFQSF